MQANRVTLDPAELLTLVAPRFFGHPHSADYWRGGNAWEPTVFIGWIPLILLAYAIFRCSEERLVRFWTVVAGVGVWLALGNPGGLYWIAFTLVPGLSSVPTSLTICSSCLRYTICKWAFSRCLGWGPFSPDQFP